MAIAQHGTLVANTVKPVHMGARISSITVINRGGTGGPFEIWFTTDGSTPSIGGTNVMVVPAVVGAEQATYVPQLDAVDTPENPTNDSIIQLVSSGAANYSLVT